MDIEHNQVEILRRECAAFSGLLTGNTRTAGVEAKYISAHAATPHLLDPPAEAVDAMLVRAARRGPVSLRCADMYARFFRPGGALRRKLVLFLAIAESAPVTHTHLNGAHEQSLPRALMRVAAVMVIGGGILVMALVRFGPAHLVAATVPARPLNPVSGSARRTGVPVAAARTVAQPVHHGEVES